MQNGVKITGKPTKKQPLRVVFMRGTCVFLLSSVLLEGTATAQTRGQNSEVPVAASPSPKSIITGEEALPLNIQPEELAAPTAQTLAPTKPPKNTTRNRWNTNTLTQNTGLSAASFYRSDQITVKQTQTQAEPRAVDVLTAEDLLSVSDPNRQIGVGIRNTSDNRDSSANLGASLRGALFDLPTNNNINGSVFKLDSAKRLCLGTTLECSANETQRVDIGYTKNIVQENIIGLDLQITPRAGLQFDEESKSALVGALVKIGDNLHETSNRKSNAWYVFAGADAESVSYTPNSARRLTSGNFHLQNRVLDTQAGVGYRIGDTNLAFTYFNRQALSDNNSYNEDAAALSITWKR